MINVDNYIKFTIIAICFLVTLASYRFCFSKKDWVLLAPAMGFTLLSDYFLLIAHNYRIGVFVFCFVHIFYILRVNGGYIGEHSREKSIINIGSVLISGGLIYVLFTFIPLLPRIDPLIIFVVMYTALFVMNFVAHVKYYYSDEPDALPMINRRLMLAGLLLFVLCDIHVFMFNLPNFLPVPPEIGLWGGSWIWMFYAPSQVLLSISAVRW